MRHVLVAFAAMLALSYLAILAQPARADDAGAKQTVTGVLIDQHCGKDMMSKDDPEAAAADHPRSCAMADDCAKYGYSVISGKKMLKFDDNGNKLAKDYLAKSNKEKDLRVSVDGTVSGDQIAVTAINDAPAK